MTKQFVVGKQYKLVDVNKLSDFVIDADKLTLPDIFTCTALDGNDCHSTDEGVLWRGIPKFEWDELGWYVASHAALDAGVFEEVAE